MSKFVGGGGLVCSGTTDPSKQGFLERQDLLLTLQNVVRATIALSQSLGGTPIDDSQREALELCTAVYRILTHRIADGALFPQERLALVWNYIRAQSEHFKGDLIQQVLQLRSVRQAHGQCKALIRLAFNQGAMATFFESFHKLLLYEDPFSSEHMFSAHSFMLSSSAVAEAEQIFESLTVLGEDNRPQIVFAFVIDQPALDRAPSSQNKKPVAVPSSPGPDSPSAGLTPPIIAPPPSTYTPKTNTTNTNSTLSLNSATVSNATASSALVPKKVKKRAGKQAFIDPDATPPVPDISDLTIHPSPNQSQQQQQQQQQEQQRLQKLEQQKLEQQRLEQQRLEQQQLEQQRLEQQRLEQQRLEQQRLEQQMLEQQRLGQQKLQDQFQKQRLGQETATQLKSGNTRSLTSTPAPQLMKSSLRPAQVATAPMAPLQSSSPASANSLLLASSSPSKHFSFASTELNATRPPALRSALSLSEMGIPRRDAVTSTAQTLESPTNATMSKPIPIASSDDRPMFAESMHSSSQPRNIRNNNSFRERAKYMAMLNISATADPGATAMEASSLPVGYGRTTAVEVGSLGRTSFLSDLAATSTECTNSNASDSSDADDHASSDGDDDGVNILENLDDKYVPETLRASDSADQKRNQVSTNVDLVVHYTLYSPFAIEGSQFTCSGCKKSIELPSKSDARKKVARFCAFTGKYFCTNCHQQDKRVLPAAIVQKWDFKRRRVCVLAKEYLDDIFSSPCIDLRQMTSKTISEHKTIQKILRYRQQIALQREFILTCRETQFARMTAIVEPHMFLLASDPTIFTLETLVAVHKGDFKDVLKRVVKEYTKHIVEECSLCREKGSYCAGTKDGTCTLPNDKSPLYPFMDNCRVCPTCSTVYHAQCFGSQCRRCKDESDQLTA